MKPWEEAKIKPWEEAKKAKGNSYEGYARGFLESLPVAGGIMGGVLGTPLGPLGMAAGGGLGAAGGKALENIGESFLGDEKTRKDIYLDPVKEGAMGLAAEGAGQVVGKGIGKVADFGKNMVGQFRRMPVENSQEIIDAAQRIETKPTTGMLTESKLRQNFEGSIAQSPYQAGEGIRRHYKDVYQKLGKASDEVLEGAVEVSPVEAGNFAKDEIANNVEKALKPANEIYENLAKESPYIKIEDAAKVAEDITNIKSAQLKSGDSRSIVNNVRDDLLNIKTLDELRELKTIINAEMRAADGGKKYILSQVDSKLKDLEELALRKAANQSGNVEALKKANKLYGNYTKSLKSLADQMKLGKVNNYRDFLRKIESMPEEDLYKKMSNLNKIGSVIKMRQMFPRAYQAMRKGKLTEIYKKSSPKGELSPARLVNNLKKLNPEAKLVIFGKEGVNKIKDIETVSNAIPDLFNPSQTSRALEYMEFNPIKPTSWLSEIDRRIQNYLLQNPDKISEFGIRTYPMQRSAIRGLISQPAARGLLDEED